MANNRVVPADQDAEEAVLGALFISDADIYFYAGMTTPTEAIPQAAIDYHNAHLGPAVQQTLKLLEPGDFYRDRHGWIYQAIRKLKRAGSHANQITVAHQLALEGKLEACGGAAYLSHLIANCPTTVFLLDYAKIVRDTATKRGLIGAARQIEEIGYSGSPGKEAKEMADSVLNRLSQPKGPTLLEFSK